MSETAIEGQQRKKRRFRFKAPGLSGWILISIILGVVTGLFFGEIAGKIGFIGDAYIKLIQMTVLPYILVSLIAGIGSLSVREAGLMARKGGVWLLLIWAIGFLVILLMPLTFPKWVTASFFTSSLVEAPETVNFLDLYIPSNPFFSLSAGLIPAIVLFSLALGIALMNLKTKGAIINACHTISKALVAVSGFMVKLSPIGLFAITAAAAGTLTPAEFGRLQVYIIVFIIASLLLSLWILPALVSAFTPFSYRDVMKRFQAPFLVAFATGNLFVVLPILIEGCKEMFREHKTTGEDADNYVDVLLPVYFNFPNLGKLLIILFILFAFWFNGSTLPLASYPSFIITGLITFFGSLDLAIPFLLDFFRLPADLYNLYIVSGVITGRFATLVGAVNLVVFTLLTTAAVTGLLKIRKIKLLVYIGALVLSLTATVAGLTLFIDKTMDNPYNRDIAISTRELYYDAVPAVVRDERPEDPPKRQFERKMLDEIIERGVLRVGYRKNSLPWSYRNNIGELVGLDIELAHLLAGDLGVSLEFIPYEMDMLDKDLLQRRFDIVMSSILTKTYSGSHMNYTESYMDISAAFVVPDHMRNDFESIDKIKSMGYLKIGYVSGGFNLSLLQSVFPRIIWTEIDDMSEFFGGNRPDLDGVFGSAESGSAWTLLHPEFNVSVVKPSYVRYPVSFVTGGNDIDFTNYVNRWISIIKRNGQFDTMYGYWVQGKDKPEDIPPRWSVIRDVLGWIE